MTSGQDEPRVHVTYRNPETGELIDQIMSASRFEDRRDVLVARGWEVIQAYDIVLDDPPITIRVHRAPPVEQAPPPARQPWAWAIGRILYAVIIWGVLLGLLFVGMGSCMKGA